MRMGPDRTNYQVWLIDYLDGTLDNSREALLFAFLEQNPDIREEMNDLITLSVRPGDEKFTGREKLKKDPAMIPGKQFELLCIGAVENDLSEEQRSEFDRVLSVHPEKRRIFDQYQKVRLTAPELKFRYKYKLRRQPLAIRLLQYFLVPLAAAAAVLLIITVLTTPAPQESFENPLTSAVDTLVLKSELPVMRTVHPGITAIAKAVLKQPEEIKIQKPVMSENEEKDKTTLFFTRTEIPGVAYGKTDLVVAVPDLRLAEIRIIPVSDEGNNEEPGLFTFISKFFREKINISSGQERGPLKVYEIADAGITGLNKLLGWDMTLQKKRNEKGEVISVSFNSKLLKFSAPVKKGVPVP